MEQRSHLHSMADKVLQYLLEQDLDQIGPGDDTADLPLITGYDNPFDMMFFHLFDHVLQGPVLVNADNLLNHDIAHF
nr:hypothetical protein [Thiohalophilus thiocyanatoxydans]